MRSLALHGFALALPPDWEVVSNRGDWSAGNVVLVERHVPQLSLSWQRQQREPDFGRTLAKLERRVHREQQALPEGRTALRHGQLSRYRAQAGDYHAAVIRPDPEQPLTLILRQLSPGSEAQLRTLIDSCMVFDEGRDAVIPWRLHDMRADLPSGWRLEAVQDLVGVTRMMWVHYVPGRRRRSDQLLVLRRLACAERQLEGLDPQSWLHRRIDHHRERLLEPGYQDDLFTSWVDAPGDNLWRRWRGIRERRHVAIWTETAEDRLLVQEWKGAGDHPLPPLRDCRAFEDASPALGERKRA